jgi:hypothetical protein
MFENFCAEEYLKYIPGRAVLSYIEFFIYPRYTGECRFLNDLNLFHPSQLKICIFAFRKDPACSLPASARFWLDNFLFLTATATATASAAPAEGRIYFTCVVRVFTKTAAIRVLIINKFTDFIISDKHFL